MLFRLIKRTFHYHYCKTLLMHYNMKAVNSPKWLGLFTGGFGIFPSFQRNSTRILAIIIN